LSPDVILIAIAAVCAGVVILVGVLDLQERR
jgi:hypothetical protein